MSLARYHATGTDETRPSRYQTHGPLLLPVVVVQSIRDRRGSGENNTSTNRHANGQSGSAERGQSDRLTALDGASEESNPDRTLDGKTNNYAAVVSRTNPGWWND